MDDLIIVYFTLGLQQKEMLACLALKHDIFISARTLRRKLQKLKLYRKIEFSNVANVASFIDSQLKTHGQLHGYKWMHRKCLNHKFVVTQQTVRQLLNILDPQGVEMRRRKRLKRRQYHNKGPNYLWHFDCYDKLKPYGICISGCIDGFSRYIIWLRASNNSNNPKIIAHYYTKSIDEKKGIPRTLRADLGTENVLVERLQNILRESKNIENALPSFLYGTSTSNQRIEAWWSILRKHHAQFWMNLFQHLKDNGYFDGSFLDKALIQFCFMDLIQLELDEFATEWNTHRISSSRNSNSPCGRPFIMYHIPALYHSKDYLINLAEDEILFCFDQSSKDVKCDEDVSELANIIMIENNLKFSQDPNDLVDLYVTLRTLFLDVI